MAQGTLATIMEPYRKGTSFSEWIERLGSVFRLNKIKEEDKKDYFATLCGPSVYSEVKLLFPNTNYSDIKFDEMVTKLKSRFDKTESDFIQRFKFNHRVQQPDESVEDFVLSVKLQAEFCSFENFKQKAILDRIVAGVRDKALQQRLLSEENLTLSNAEKIVITWEMASSNAKSMKDNSDQIGLIRHDRSAGIAYKKLEKTLGLARSLNGDNERGPVKDRLGYRPYGRQRQVDWKRDNSRNQQPYEDRVCGFCGLKGHLKRKCFKLKNLKRDTVKFMDTWQAEHGSKGPSDETTISGLFNRLRTDKSESEDEEYDAGDLECMMVSSINKINNPCLVNTFVDGKLLTMEVDCGASVSVIGKNQYFRTFDKPLSKSNKQLIVVNGNRLSIRGEANVSVKFREKLANMQLLVIDCENEFIPLLGRSWLDVFFSNWREFFTSTSTINGLNEHHSDITVNEVKQKFANVFKKDFSFPIKDFEADLVLKSEIPIFRKAYDVPYRLRDKVLDYLDRLEKEEVITPIKTSEWASPVVIVMKKNNDIRLVIDCKVSVNKLIIPNTYPLPTAQDLFAGLAGCKIFCSLDLEGAYTQLSLTERSRKFMVINTIKGLFIYNRLPQGASSSASIFQQVMDQILEGLEYVYCYLDDVLIAGKDFDDCKRKLFLVLERLNNANIKVNLDKCKFFVSQLDYLGHILSDKGLSPCPDKIATIQKARVPQNVTELKSFLGLINYYNKFIPNLSSKLFHLYNLLKKNVRFVWDKHCNEAFETAKRCLLATNFLEYFDAKKPIAIITDASSYGLGGVIAHIVDGVEKPICFTSFSLNAAQKSYPILHLEALALVCTVKKFHKYLYGQTFKVFTDHKPLLGIFGKSGKNPIIVTRLQRFIMELSIYDFEIFYRPSHKMGNADFCSRFPLEQTIPMEYGLEYIRSINFSGEIPLNFNTIAEETKKDDFLQKLIFYMQQGWPDHIGKQYKNVFANQSELEMVDGCLLYQDKVVIPQQLHKEVLKLLHANHNGIVKMKQLARRTVYWFGINQAVEKFVACCEVCNGMAVVPKQKIESKWTPTTKPFSRIHIDFFHFSGHIFLLIIDSFSKWLEVEWMKRGTDCSKVLTKLVEFFARFGLPDCLVSDGGPPFNSLSFVEFLGRQGITVLKSPPYNPASNGQAERLVRTTKEVLKKFLIDPDIAEVSLEDQLYLFLFNYRNTCLTNDEEFPSERIFSYKPKTLLDLINPKKQFKHNLFVQNDRSYDENASASIRPEPLDPLDNLTSGDFVWYKNHNPHNHARWLKAVFLKRVSRHILQVEIGSVQTTAHRTQIRLFNDPDSTRPNISLPTPSTQDMAISSTSPVNIGSEHHRGPQDDPPNPGVKRKREQHQSSSELRRSKRIKQVKSDSDFVYYDR